MRAFTPDIEAALEWFVWTHEPTEVGWRRIALPRDGGLARQDARTMVLVDVVRRTANEMQRERADERARKDDVANWRASRRRQE